MKKTKSKLREVYEAKPFHQRKRFDDGGGATTGSNDQSLINLVTSPQTSYFPSQDTSYAPVPYSSTSPTVQDPIGNDTPTINYNSQLGAPVNTAPINSGSVPSVNTGSGSSGSNVRRRGRWRAPVR